MAQYLLSVHHGPSDPVPAPEDMQQMFDDVGVFNELVRQAGKWVFAGGLEGIESATTVDSSGPEPVITDGPFAESKEYLGGFWIIEATDLDDALAWAAEGSAACRGRVEVRPFQSA